VAMGLAPHTKMQKYNLKELINMAAVKPGSSTIPNLYQKISDITEALGLVQKDSTAPKEMGGYRFISHGMMLGHLRHELTSRNVVIVPSGEELLRFETYTTNSGKQGRHAVLKFNFMVVNGDNTAEFFEASWIGEGQDTGDKGVQKSGTSAEKYFLMKLFKVGDKDDPDAIDTEPAKPQVNKPTETNNGTPTATQEVQKPAEKETVSSVAAKKDDGPAHDQKAQVDALVWFGEQLPPSSKWFRGKIVPLVGLWDNMNKSGKLKPEMAEAGSAVNWVFGQIAASHHEVCGEDCPHLQAAQLAVIMDGRISEKA
jgi:hypothetical protein